MKAVASKRVYCPTNYLARNRILWIGGLILITPVSCLSNLGKTILSEENCFGYTRFNQIHVGYVSVINERFDFTRFNTFGLLASTSDPLEFLQKTF